MAFLDFLFGKKEKTQQLPTISPEQQNLLKQLLQMINPHQMDIGQQPTFQSGQNFLQQLLGGDTSEFEDPLMRQFQEQIIPGLAERFSGAGAGAQSSSAFQQALGGAGADLSERLASLRGQLKMQALPQALGYAQAPGQRGLQQAQLGLGTQSFENLLRPRTQGLLGGLLGGAGSGFGSGLGSMLGRGIF
jgi:hypothetical protein